MNEQQYDTLIEAGGWLSLIVIFFSLGYAIYYHEYLKMLPIFLLSVFFFFFFMVYAIGKALKEIEEMESEWDRNE